MKWLSIFSVFAVLAVAGCGGSSNSSSSSSSSGGASSGGGGGTQLALKTDPQQLKYNTSQLSAPAGKVTITMTNTQGLQHDIAIKGGVDAKGDVVGQGG